LPEAVRTAALEAERCRLVLLRWCWQGRPRDSVPGRPGMDKRQYRCVRPAAHSGGVQLRLHTTSDDVLGNRLPEHVNSTHSSAQVPVSLRDGRFTWHWW